MSLSLEQHRLGVAVVGLGIREQHARAYQAIGRCQLRWLYDVEPKKAEWLADQLGEGMPARGFEQICEIRKSRLSRSLPMTTPTANK